MTTHLSPKHHPTHPTRHIYAQKIRPQAPLIPATSVIYRRINRHSVSVIANRVRVSFIIHAVECEYSCSIATRPLLPKIHC
jgi:hypothetical protein